MIVAGGSYVENCIFPYWRRVFGSGGRAAIVIGDYSRNVQLHTYAGPRFAASAVHTMRSFGIKPKVKEIAEDISFSYFHSLSAARLSPEKPKQNKPLKIDGDTVLRFGFIEGDALVHADRAIYDPQGGPNIPKFEANGSRARHLAYVLNENEALSLTKKSTVREAAKALLGGSTEVVVIKRGPRGALVFEKGRNRAAVVPAYKSEQVFKIGSGDVFSAVFAYEWGENKIEPTKAADVASRTVSCYVESRSLALPSKKQLKERRPIRVKAPAGRIYLAGPFFDITQRWLIEEALLSLEALGADVFSPYHDVGLGEAKDVARKDLKGLRGSRVVLALLNGKDPGTLFEIGYAVKKRIPVVAFGENISTTDLTMLIGSGCEVVDDFASAVYRVLWKSYEG